MTTLPGFHATAVGIVDDNPSILVGDRPENKLRRTLDYCFPTVREDAMHVRLMHQGLRGCTLPEDRVRKPAGLASVREQPGAPVRKSDAKLRNP